MRMEMSLSHSFEQRQTLRYEMTITGGASESIFPELDALLLDTEYQKALQFVAARKEMDRYRSMVDFLVSEVFTEFRPDAFAFYRGKGPQLRFLVTEKERACCERLLVKGLEIAYEAFCKQRQLSWESFRREVLALSA